MAKKFKNQDGYLAVADRIEKLKKEISRLRFLYHVKNDPQITDDVYESLTKELKSLEKKYPELADENSEINRVAGQPLKSFKKVNHQSMMFSLNDVFNEQEIKDWENRILKIIKKDKDVNYFCELKLDGLSASLIYENGFFSRGATRGNGLIGEDVSQNLKMINTIPLKLKAPFPDFLEVRGEVVMPKRVWFNLNQKQEKLNKPIFANPRNAAAGTLRQLNSAVVQERKLDFFAWDINQIKIKEKNNLFQMKNHSDKHQILRNFGFAVYPYEKKAKNLKEVFSFIKEIEKIRKDFPYLTDGMVVSVDDLVFQNQLGFVGKAPRSMVAFKYQAERATTIVQKIEIQVGRTGVLTPLAYLKPVFVDGSNVSRATLHNLDQIERLDIWVGDTVVIQKAGDIIPEIVQVLKNLRTGKEQKFKMPKFCPACSSAVEKKEILGNLSKNNKKSVSFYCVNKECPAKNQRKLEHFVKAFEIYEIGPKIISRLKDEGLIQKATDFFTLQKSDLSKLERFGVKSAENIISSISAHKKIPFWRFIYALGIDNVGEQTSRDLAGHFDSLNQLKKASLIEISEIENIGPVVAKNVFDFFKLKSNLKFIDELFLNGVSIYSQKNSSSKLINQIFVLTGTLEKMSREEVKRRIVENGGKVSNSVSAKTSYLLAGVGPGSKYKEAEKLKIKIISEQEFLKMI